MEHVRSLLEPWSHKRKAAVARRVRRYGLKVFCTECGLCGRYFAKERRKPDGTKGVVRLGDVAHRGCGGRLRRATKKVDDWPRLVIQVDEIRVMWPESQL